MAVSLFESRRVRGESLEDPALQGARLEIAEVFERGFEPNVQIFNSIDSLLICTHCVRILLIKTVPDARLL